ncbi:MAG: hypothetical protein HZA00_05125 [Nitrospinae bacterium]|nr:hypothetical protein [Nitrospinota bacterium]
MGVYDLLNKVLTEGKDGKDMVRWEKVGVMIEKEDGKLSVKLNLVPVQWDGWLVVKKRNK